MQSISDEIATYAAHYGRGSDTQRARYFMQEQQVLRMEWEGGHTEDPNLVRRSTGIVARIEHWWRAGRSGV